jgi:hypothetical protein
MNRTLLAIALLSTPSLLAASAHAQSVPLAGNGVSPSTMQYGAMPSSNPDPKGTVAPFNGTAEQAIVKDEIRSAGYMAVNSLYRESDGSWHARAQKNNVDVAVVVDRSGHVSTQ